MVDRADSVVDNYVDVEWVRVAPEQADFRGTLCTDGSFESHPLSAFSQVGWGIVSINEERNARPVWRPLVQSAPSAAFCDVAATAQLTGMRTHVVSDCQVLLDHILKPEAKLFSHNSIFAGYMRYAYMQQG